MSSINMIPGSIPCPMPVFDARGLLPQSVKDDLKASNELLVIYKTVQPKLPLLAPAPTACRVPCKGAPIMRVICDLLAAVPLPCDAPPLRLVQAADVRVVAGITTIEVCLPLPDEVIRLRQTEAGFALLGGTNAVDVAAKIALAEVTWEAWSFVMHPTWGAIPRLVENTAGGIDAVYPTAAEVGGQFHTLHQFPDGYCTPVCYAPPATSFQMGDDQSPADQRKIVDVPATFLGRWQITNKEWNRYARANKLAPKPEGDKADHPVTEVSAIECEAFCAWAGMALPHESEWERAARGDDGRIYPWGNEPPTDDKCWSSVTSYKNSTAPVGERPAGASPYGMEDMAGNVWEWTADVYE